GRLPEAARARDPDEGLHLTKLHRVSLEDPPGRRGGSHSPLRSSAAVTSSGISHGSSTTNPPWRSLASSPAASTRLRTSATASASGSTIVQLRRPTVPSGAGPTPCPFHTLKPRWW